MYANSGLGDAHLVERGLLGSHTFRVRLVCEDGNVSLFSSESAPVELQPPAAESLSSLRCSTEPIAALAGIDIHHGASRLGGECPTAQGTEGIQDQTQQDAQIQSWIVQLVDLGLSEAEAAIALRESGGASLSAAADWHFSQSQGYQPQPQLVAPLQHETESASGAQLLVSSPSLLDLN